MNIYEATKKALVKNGVISRVGSTLNIKPTDTPECCIISNSKNGVSASRWEPSADDLTANDWTVKVDYRTDFNKRTEGKFIPRKAMREEILSELSACALLATRIIKKTDNWSNITSEMPLADFVKIIELYLHYTEK